MFVGVVFGNAIAVTARWLVKQGGMGNGVGGHVCCRFMLSLAVGCDHDALLGRQEGDEGLVGNDAECVAAGLRGTGVLAFTLSAARVGFSVGVI